MKLLSLLLAPVSRVHGYLSHIQVSHLDEPDLTGQTYSSASEKPISCRGHTKLAIIPMM